MCGSRRRRFTGTGFAVSKKIAVRFIPELEREASLQAETNASNLANNWLANASQRCSTSCSRRSSGVTVVLSDIIQNVIAEYIDDHGVKQRLRVITAECTYRAVVHCDGIGSTPTPDIDTVIIRKKKK